MTRGTAVAIVKLGSLMNSPTAETAAGSAMAAIFTSSLGMNLLVGKESSGVQKCLEQLDQDANCMTQIDSLTTKRRMWI